MYISYCYKFELDIMKNIDNEVFEQRVMKEGPLVSDGVKCFLATYPAV